jgi:hypothetical protein
MLVPVRGDGRQQREDLAHATVYPTKTKPTGLSRNHRRLGNADATRLQNSDGHDHNPDNSNKPNPFTVISFNTN